MWYYEQNGNRIGPVDEATIRSLIANRTISIDTLVWTNGMANWTPLQQTQLAVGLPVPPPSPSPNAPTTQVGTKNRVAFILLAIFCTGGLGIHNFYIGRTNIGLIQLAITLASLCTIAILPLYIAIHIGLFIWRIVEACTVTKDGTGATLS